MEVLDCIDHCNVVLSKLCKQELREQCLFMQFDFFTYAESSLVSNSIIFNLECNE